MTAITFVGLGAIGFPMASRISEAGHQVAGVDPLPASRERAAGIGIDAYEHLSQAPQNKTVVVMVATPAQLKTLVDDALTIGVAGSTWVVMSTVGPDSIREQGARLVAAGANVVDSPVTGGVARARTGELNLFAAGDEQVVEGVRAVLEPLGRINLVGSGLGEGQAIKVINQHLCSVHIVAAAEALSLAERLGLDREQVLRLVEAGAAGSWMLSDRGPRMLLGPDCEVTSTIGIFVKDSGMVVDAGHAVGAQIPLVEIANQRYLAAVELGLGQRDDSQVVQTYRNQG